MLHRQQVLTRRHSRPAIPELSIRLHPFYRLREAGAEVRVVAPHKGTYESKHGYPVKADHGADEVKAADFDAVIIPGGYAPDHMRRNKAMVELVRESVQQGKVVAQLFHVQVVQRVEFHRR